MGFSIGSMVLLLLPGVIRSEEMHNPLDGPYEISAKLLRSARMEEWKTVELLRNRLEGMSPPPPSEVKEASAFWVNLYNGLVLWKKSLNPDGLKKATSRKLFFTRPLLKMGGENWSLDDIEHGVLRGNLPQGTLKRRQIPQKSGKLAFVITHVDPRIHGALNCGATSCPPIAFYDPKNLENQLDMAIANLILQSNFDPEKNIIHVSKIFEWYQEDFKKPPLLKWFDRFFHDKDFQRARKSGKKIKITFMKYQWK